VRERYDFKLLENNEEISVGKCKMKNKIEIAVIGSGTAIPTKNHSPASIFMSADGFNALLDIGPGSISKLPYYDINVFTIENIFITHFHPDHILDLATFFLICDFGAKERNGLNLNLVGPIGMKNFVTNLMQLFPDIQFPSNPINYIEMDQSEININQCRVQSILSGHTKNSISYRFEFNQTTIIYTGDCIYSKGLEDFSYNSDLLICECSFPEGWETKDHMTSREVGSLAQKAHVKKLIVTHLYPPAFEVDINSQIAKYYSGEILIATDGDRITIQ